MDDQGLRPLERVVMRLADRGMSSSEIAWRFRRSPGHIDRVLRFSRLPRSASDPMPADSRELRPVERMVMRARGNGVHHTEIAARMRRSPEFVARVEELVTLKRGGAGSGS